MWSRLLGYCTLLSLASATPTSYEADRHQSDNTHSISNANHIFNVIHSSMRQWGSSWNHNGVSFFLATVPANTEFYHGSSTSDPVKGMQWLAFEPEHAYNFASLHMPPAGDHGDHGRRPPQTLQPQLPEAQHRIVCEAQNPVHLDDSPPRAPRPYPPVSLDPGYLHTYRTKHTLSLIYIDGISAGKSSIGTLDSQNHILLNWTYQDDRGGGFMNEGKRAKELCDIAADKWKSTIDGFIRMEMGFEMILCDFEKHLDHEIVLRTQRAHNASFGSFGRSLMFSWYRGIAARFDGMGYDRVALDYDDFVTAYAHDNGALFPDGPGSPPRLQNLSLEYLDTLRKDVDRLVLNHKLPHHKDSKSTNWQAVADLIVTRYSAALPYLATLTNLTVLQLESNTLMRPFIDYSARNLSAEIDRCTTHFLPPNAPTPSTAQKAITQISHRICTTLLTTLNTSSIEETRHNLQDLIEYLDWSTWRRCTSQCPYDEVCFIPIWPVGTVEDRERGRGECRGQDRWMPAEGQSYWFKPGEEPGMRPPPRRGHDHGLWGNTGEEQV